MKLSRDLEFWRKIKCQQSATRLKPEVVKIMTIYQNYKVNFNFSHRDLLVHVFKILIPPHYIKLKSLILTAYNIIFKLILFT